MPLFRFVCGDCGTDSELLIRGSESPACPACSSERLVKQLSLVNAVGQSSAPIEGCGASQCCRMTGNACMN